MKRFTVMLSEDVIAQIKKANYNPSKKRVLIESILKNLFYQLDGLDYPKYVAIEMRLSKYEK